MQIRIPVFLNSNPVLFPILRAFLTARDRFEVLLAFPISNLVSAVTLEIRKNKKLERSACMQLDSACLHGLLLVCLFTFVVVWRGINSTKGDGNQMLSHIYEYKLFPFFYSVGFQMEFNLIVCNFIYILRINI